MIVFASDPDGPPLELFLGLIDLSNATHWVFVSLLLFIALLLWKKVPALLAKSLDARADAIRAELDQARQLREEAQELLASYTRKQRAAEKEADAIIAQAKKEARLYGNEMRVKLSEQLERRAEIAKHRIAQAQVQAETLVRDKAIDLAVAATTIALETSVPVTTKTKLLDTGIKELSSRL